LPVIAGLLVLVSAVLAALGYRGRDQVVGIDLGTTFSVVALKSGDKITIVPDYITGKLLVPSVVTHFLNGSRAVGDSAVALRGVYPSETIFNAKRFIGRSLGEVAQDADRHPYQVSANFSRSSAEPSARNSSALAGFVIPAEGGDRWVSPVEVAAEVVRHLKQSVASYLGYGISRTVICVPAKFTWRETKATQEAFERAGFKVARVLEEPTAAAVAYGLHRGTGVRHVLVYDIGGGTLDTSLLYMNGKSVSVLGVAGDDHLGGSDFDQRMQSLLEAKLADAALSTDASQAEERCDSIGLYILAEAVKIRLSSEQRVETKCRGEDGQDRILVMTREEFEAGARDLFDRAMAPVEKVLADQMMTSLHVDDIVLVGGASRTPKIRSLLRDFFGDAKKLHTDIDPDITVAWGAASILD